MYTLYNVKVRLNIPISSNICYVLKNSEALSSNTSNYKQNKITTKPMEILICYFFLKNYIFAALGATL
jgi:hypothetical protein